jgi:hypothetical protein
LWFIEVLLYSGAARLANLTPFLNELNTEKGAFMELTLASHSAFSKLSASLKDGIMPSLCNPNSSRSPKFLQTYFSPQSINAISNYVTV